MKCNHYGCKVPAQVVARIHNKTTDLVTHKRYCIDHLGESPELAHMNHILLLDGFQQAEYDTDTHRVKALRTRL